MALDGMFLYCLKEEIIATAINSKIDKIYQPSREEIILNMRSKNGTLKLLMSARANSARVHFTQNSPENPATPPMFCMLLRKHLTGAILTNVRQHELDRILFFDFDAVNEIGDKVKLCLCIEIMAQHSNVILIDFQGKIIDSLKRVDFSKSSVRQVLPALEYKLPPEQNKLNLVTTDTKKVVKRILEHSEKALSTAILSSVMGVSPIVCREISYLSCGGDFKVSQLNDDFITLLGNNLNELAKALLDNRHPIILYDENNKPFDFSFFDISQYNPLVCKEEVDSFSNLLDTFYSKKDRIERISKSSQNLRKSLTTILERTSRKLDVQKAELEKCKDREKLRIFAELITAHQYSLKKGLPYYDLPNYYDNNNLLRVPADPALSPIQNSQKYYKEYKKTYTAEKMLKDLIENGKEEIVYLESVLDSLTRAESETELVEIKKELIEGGYVRLRKQDKVKKSAPLPPICFYSSDGFKILVGRNNIQNDKLSLKSSAKNDVWLHTKDFPGAHVVIVAGQKEISDIAINEAAVVAAVYSKASNSSKVPVDFTQIKNLKKPNGAKPGKVIYHIYNTIYVTPDSEVADKLKAND